MLVFPTNLLRAAEQDERIRQGLLKESALFQAQRHSLDSEAALMRTQRAARGTGNRRRDRRRSRRRKVRWHCSAATSMSNRGLIKEGFISNSRISQLEAVVMDYAAKLEERRTELARAAQRLVDIDLKLQSIRNAYVRAASDQLKATAQRLGEIEQEQRKSDDAALRQVVVAPASGEVIDLKFTSPGAVVGAWGDDRRHRAQRHPVDDRSAHPTGRRQPTCISVRRRG